jgi:hypothetical protein
LNRWVYLWTLVIITLASAAFLLLRGSSLPLPDHPARGPRLERWTTLETYLGEGKLGEILSGSFRLRNVGTEPLTFTIRAGCDCASLSPREGIIPPGEIQEVSVGVRLRYEGKDEHVRLEIYTNDPDAAPYVLEVRGNCPAAFLTAPRSLDFNDVVEGTERTLTLRVLGPQGEPLPSSADLRFHSTSDHWTVDRASTADEGWVLAVKLRATAPRGHIQGEIVLSLPEAEREVKVPVVAYVVAPVLVAPRTVTLRATEQRADGPREGKFIVWRPDGQHLGRLTKIDPPEGIVVEESGDPKAIRRLFVVRASGNTGASERMRLWFEQLQEPVEVRLGLSTSGPDTVVAP